jgi:hypothetical protein
VRYASERPFRADDHAGQVVAGIVLGGAPRPHDASVRQHQFHAENVVDRHAVLERVRPARIGRDVAADGAGALARRVGREVKALAPDVIGEPKIDDPGLHHGVAIAVVDFEDPLHAREGNHHAAADRQAAAGQAGAGAARQERHVQLVARLDDGHDLLGRSRKNDDIGLVLFDGEAVALVYHQITGRMQEIAGADDGV